jgi:hypothetical protein
MMLRFFWSKSSRKMSTGSKSQQYEQYFHYTSGRWLWDEERELRARYMKFNVAELKRIAAESVGAKSCVSMIFDVRACSYPSGYSCMIACFPASLLDLELL